MDEVGHEERERQLGVAAGSARSCAEALVACGEAIWVREAEQFALVAAWADLHGAPSDPDVVRGRRMTGYPACGPEAKAAGANWVDAAMDDAVVDGKLVTAPAWPAHPKWLARLLEVMGTRVEHAEAVTL